MEWMGHVQVLRLHLRRVVCASASQLLVVHVSSGTVGMYAPSHVSVFSSLHICSSRPRESETSYTCPVSVCLLKPLSLNGMSMPPSALEKEEVFVA